MMYDAIVQTAMKALRTAAKNPAARKKLAELAATNGARIAKSRLTAMQKQRAQQALAVELARQTEGGKLSYGTLIDGERHTVVWVGDEPLQAFPPFEGDLGVKLTRYRRELLQDPPIDASSERRRVPWRRGHASTEDGPAANASPPVQHPTPRTDEAGAAFAGSQLQTQLWVNKRARELAEAIGGLFPELGHAEVEWRSPVAADGYAEYSGSAFLRAVELDEHLDELRTFWPARGPQWDGLAIVRRPGRPAGVLLVEGKSYPDEMLKGSPTTSPPGSANRERIDSSLAWARSELGVAEQHADEWVGQLYQNANRLAHLLWLRSIGVEAWFVHLLFTDDDTTHSTSAGRWEEAVRAADRRLGLPGQVLGAGHLVLGSGTHEELAG